MFTRSQVRWLMGLAAYIPFYGQKCSMMDTSQVNTDFEQLGVAFQKYVREKAMRADSTIVYYEGNLLIEENPKTGEKEVLKKYNHF